MPAPGGSTGPAGHGAARVTRFNVTLAAARRRRDAGMFGTLDVRGAPLSKLGKIAEQAERLLRALAIEANIDQSSGEWLALKTALLVTMQNSKGSLPPRKRRSLIDIRNTLSMQCKEVSTLCKEANQPYFQVRELSAESLVKCTYTSAQYPGCLNAYAYCAMPFPNDQFSFGTSKRFTKMFSGLIPGFLARSSTMRA
jgi:hypothetical protein